MARNQLIPSSAKARSSKRGSTQAGFTLIELIMVVTLSVILMLGASALFMTFLVSNTKVTSQQELKNEGEYALRQVEFLLRNATKLVADPNNSACVNNPTVSCYCSANMFKISLKSRDDGITTLSAQDGKIASDSGTAVNSGVYLTSSDYTLNNLRFDCTGNANGSSPYVQVRFTLSKGTASNDDYVTQDFSTGVSLRN
jgi:prepilin-type N-terminal cleavage/methylation domain-containing protein